MVDGINFLVRNTEKKTLELKTIELASNSDMVLEINGKTYTITNDALTGPSVFWGNSNLKVPVIPVSEEMFNGIAAVNKKDNDAKLSAQDARMAATEGIKISGWTIEQAEVENYLPQETYITGSNGTSTFSMHIIERPDLSSEEMDYEE